MRSLGLSNPLLDGSLRSNRDLHDRESSDPFTDGLKRHTESMESIIRGLQTCLTWHHELEFQIAGSRQSS